jgi:hypothetical protein
MDHGSTTTEVDGPDATTRSRRRLLGGTLAGIGAWVAGSLLARDADAANGQPVVLGRGNAATRATIINSTGAVDGLIVQSSRGGISGVARAAGVGVRGRSLNGIGVSGSSGLRAGVAGLSEAGPGVHGSSVQGAGVLAQSREGIALEVQGQAVFSSSGLAAIPARVTSIAVSPSVPLTTTSKVLCTVIDSPGPSSWLHYVEVQPAAGTFTVVLSGASTRAARLAWFVLM